MTLRGCIATPCLGRSVDERYRGLWCDSISHDIYRYILHACDSLSVKRKNTWVRALHCLRLSFYRQVCCASSLRVINAVILQHTGSQQLSKERHGKNAQPPHLLTAAPCILPVVALPFSFPSVVAVARDSCGVRERCLFNAICESPDALGRFLTAVVKPRTGRGRSWASATALLRVLHEAVECRVYKVLCATCGSAFVGEGPVACDVLMMP